MSEQSAGRAAAQPASIAAEQTLPWRAMLGISLGVFMATVDMSIVNITLPTLMVELGVSLATVEWVILSYALVVTSLMLGVARLGDMLGKKRVYLWGLAVFTMGSLLCGAAPGAYALIVFRGLQALGAVMMQALGVAIITDIVTPSRRGRALGLIGSVVALGLAVGPPLGGMIIGLVGWRAIFLVNVPVGILALAVVRRHIPADAPARGGQTFDAAGALILFLTLVCYALGMTMGQHGGFSSPSVLGLLALAVLGLGVFLRVQAVKSQPMVDLSMFRQGRFSLGLLMGWICFLLMGGAFILPLFLQMARGYAPQHVGLLMMVVPVSMGMISPWAGSLSDRYGSRLISLLGLLVLAGGCLTISGIDEYTDAWGYILRVAPMGLGMGLFQSPNNSAIMGAAPRERLGLAGGLLALSRTLGTTTGLPLLGAFFSARVEAAAGLPAHSDLAQAAATALAAGVRATYLLSTALALAAAGLALGLLLAERRKGRPALD